MLLEDLEQVLFDYIDRHKITHEEFRAATDVLVGTVKAGEESMMFDVLLGARVMDNSNALREGSIEGIEGPFYSPGAPVLPNPAILPMRADEPGEVLIYHGQARSVDGAPLAGVEIDIWQADAAGLYSNFHDAPDWNLRGITHTDADGRFSIQTIVPPPYEIPYKGPTGVVLKALGRHFFRAAHLHVKVRHPGYREINSLIYFTGDEYLDSDAANAIRDALIADIHKIDDAQAISAHQLAAPFYDVEYDFVLEREA
jgi:catechol 1,2-dioxygenase